ncbi:MAG: UDP-N-acetylmuramoyl-L-alanyl-D-glutamate--2,6-diaminopimelate ligase [Hyphomicrobiales bacterium]|nr:UDP-N-acetylmuramoyl-L-alanyl-D-glutamate--2,6-diaminopimelate ligase [Hyphomicrobiales bacterium]MDE1973548.1 UDP-N-acetylmuramoyl-L-alanyl-D-glutamate--2,6-diaminopimelate ligase [Hyphomicrobiales bacterium]MDE2373113.1 UDP-N-acetylmuramoyl-L-alanyl-D-glutamate--2,6-diaminopimelate ligase [Hyphomicrobiales bacterium]
MKLREILPADAEFDARHAALEVGGVTADSRTIRAGYLFVAVAGNRTDGNEFIAAAIAAGAAAVLAEKRPDMAWPSGVAFVRAGNARRALALIAAKIFPRQPPTVAAVTGTSGKTSVAAFTRQIWTALGHRAASIGTIGIVSPSSETYGSLTTPDPVALHRSLDALASEGVTHLAIEASSHGLDQFRLDGLRLAAAAFTNITRDHLDYHPTFAAYLAAKLRLFETLVPDDGAIIVEVDHPYADAVLAAAKARGLSILTVGRKAAGIRIVDTAIDGFAQNVRLEHRGKTYRVRLPLVGEFQVENAAVAAGIAIATGGDAAEVFAALERLTGAKGRLELVGVGNGAPVFIDYAHKPDALAKALDALRPAARGRLVVVFGAGGDRDRGKRPLMGAVAAEKADRVIVTDDNPRGEDAAAIRAAILGGAQGAVEIGDRREAIRTAIAELRQGDVLLIAGKGHETGQIIGDRVVPFSDHEAVAAALKELAA